MIEVLELHPDLDYAISGDTVIHCANDTAYIDSGTSDPDLLISWTGPSSFSSSDAGIAVSESGWYFLRLTDPGGCQLIDSILIEKEINGMQVVFKPDTLLDCRVKEVINTFTTDQELGQVTWYRNGVAISNEQALLSDQDGDYLLKVESRGGCTTEAPFRIHIDTLSPLFVVNYDHLIFVIKPMWTLWSRPTHYMIIVLLMNLEY